MEMNFALNDSLLTTTRGFPSYCIFRSILHTLHNIGYTANRDLCLKWENGCHSNQKVSLPKQVVTPYSIGSPPDTAQWNTDKVDYVGNSATIQ